MDLGKGLCDFSVLADIPNELAVADGEVLEYDTMQGIKVVNRLPGA